MGNGGERGVTLVELLVALSIVVILVIALGFQYQGWQSRYAVESQAKGVYSDLMYARMRAMQTNRVHEVAFGATSYRLLRATDDAGTIFVPLWSTLKSLSYGPSWTSMVIFDTSGMVSQPSWDSFSSLAIWFTSRGADADYDCIEIRQTRLGLGKWGTAGCNVK